MKKKRNRNRRIVTFSLEFLLEIARKYGDLPDDTEGLVARVDGDTESVELLVRSESFSDVPEGVTIPRHMTVWTWSEEKS